MTMYRTKACLFLVFVVAVFHGFFPHVLTDQIHEGMRFALVWFVAAQYLDRVSPISRNKESK